MIENGLTGAYEVNFAGAAYDVTVSRFTDSTGRPFFRLTIPAHQVMSGKLFLPYLTFLNRDDRPDDSFPTAFFNDHIGLYDALCFHYPEYNSAYTRAFLELLAAGHVTQIHFDP